MTNAQDDDWWARALRQFDQFTMPDFFSPTLRREAIEQLHRFVEKPGPTMAQIDDLTFPGGDGRPLAARLYTPLAAGLGPAPIILFFHGGGFSTCSIATHDGLCRRLAASAHIRVVSVEYRLAPEHPFPAAHEDALAAWAWLTADESPLPVDIDPQRIALAGDSAGANLSLHVALDTVGEGIRPACLVLLYPWLQLADSYEGRKRLEEGHGIAVAIIEAARQPYLNGHDPHDPVVSPLFAPSLRGLPPTLVVTADHDPLAQEALAFVDRLHAEGRRVKHRHYAGTFHGFLTAARAIKPAEAATREIAADLAAMLSPTGADAT